MELSREYNSKQVEQDIKKYLADINLEKLISESNGKRKKIMFIEGPPTMNGEPHVGHLRGRVIKDLWYRYNTLRGKKVVFNAGWDTQGLPVELQAEKELGIKGGKSEILKTSGIEKLVSECKRIVHKYQEKWVQADKLLGVSLNQEKAYWTYKDEYIEREWQFLKKAHENGILTKGYRVVAYCPSCQTSLSHSEVNQGYEMVRDPSVYYKVKIEDEDLFLIVWTTMPFTIVTDAMVGFNPDEDYTYVKVDSETWVVGKTRLEEFMQQVKVQDYTVIKTVKGSEFEGKKYTHPLLNEISGLEEFSKNPNVHKTVAENFVDVNTGSGIVHLSPANGEEDYEIATKRNVPIFNPIDDEAKFTKEAGKYFGLFVRDADEKIVDSLRSHNALVKAGTIKHSYPLCWRSHHKIVWVARMEFFYMLDTLGDKAVKAAESVNYFFEPPKNRFLGIIKEHHPWCISRERFWGCPLPIWECSKCGDIQRLFSRKEIVSASSELPDGENFELHRPWIDNVIINCKKCNSRMEREQFVLDTWHNSGAAPYCSLSDDEYNESIPGPFFTEGIDQTRGWGYTLLIENVILNNKPIPPFESFLFHGHVLDKNGNKMSKSLGNVIDGVELLTKFPVDLIRFYFMWKSSPIEPLSFSTDELMSRPYQVISTLYHLHLYFKQNSEYDKFDKSLTVDAVKNKGLLKPPDIWLLSKLQKLTLRINEYNDKCRFHETAKSIEDFIINSLSQVYIPITRSELWTEDEKQKPRRLAIYAILSETLKTLDILLHPFSPFITEYLYLATYGDKKSILLENWPSPEKSLIDDNLEESFDLMKEIVSVSSAARMKGKLKRRWPLNEAIICTLKSQKKKLDSLSEFLRSQLNVEKYQIIELENQDGLPFFSEAIKSNLPLVPNVELDRKKIGPKVKQNVGKLIQKVSDTDPKKIVEGLQSGTFSFDLDGSMVTLDKDDFVLDFDAKQGYAVARREGIIVFISTTRNREMMARGLVKDLARRLQTLRKEIGYSPTDIIDTAYILDLDPESLEMIKEKADELAFLVRVKRVDFTDTAKEYKQEDIDGLKVRISVE